MEDLKIRNVELGENQYNNGLGYKLCDIESVECIGEFEDEYVYDIEMEEDPHVFFANDILIHNSIYANVEPIVNNLTDGDLSKRSNVKAIVKEIDDMVTPALNKWCEDHLSTNVFYSRIKNRIIFIREKFCDVSYFFKKKRYLLHVLDDEGKKVDKFVYKGISLTRSTYPEVAKNFIQHIYETSIKEQWDEKTFKEYITNLWYDISSTGMEGVDKIALIKNLNSYRDSSEFLVAEKGTPGHARAALYFNQLINKMDLLDQYDEIKDGRVKICYIKPNNIYGIKVIGFRDEIPKEFYDYFQIDHKKMFEILFLKPLEDFCKCNRWAQFEPNQADLIVDINEL